ncbi:hypothetical protein LCGC14_3128300, partial [marine sediment metagenome]
MPSDNGLDSLVAQAERYLNDSVPGSKWNVHLEGNDDYWMVVSEVRTEVTRRIALGPAVGHVVGRGDGPATRPIDLDYIK